MAANPNTMDIKAVWDSVYQITHYKQPVFRALADERLASLLKKGDTVHRTYKSDFFVNDMAGDGGYTTQALTDTDETLVVNKAKEVSFYIKELDELQAQLPVRVAYARKAMNKLFNQIDGDVLQTAYQGATSTIDDSDISNGTSGNGLTVNNSNVAALFYVAMQKLRLQNILVDPNLRYTGDVKLEETRQTPFAVISPQVFTQLLLFVGGKNSEFGDKVSLNGHAGMFAGFNIFVSNATAWSGDLILSTNPSDGDTFKLNNVTFQFKTTPATAGDVVIGTTAANTVTNLANALNAPATTIANSATAGYKAFSSTATTTVSGVAINTLSLLKNITATDNTTKVSLVINGWGYIPVSTTLTPAVDVWTTTKQIQHCLFGVAKSVSLVIQQTPKLKLNPVGGKVGVDVVTWVPYGLKVFTDQKPMLVDAQIRSDGFTNTPALVTN